MCYTVVMSFYLLFSGWKLPAILEVKNVATCRNDDELASARKEVADPFSLFRETQEADDLSLYLPQSCVLHITKLLYFLQA
jgi:hypothetical protein